MPASNFSLSRKPLPSIIIGFFINCFKNFVSSDLNSDHFVKIMATSESLSASSILKQILHSFGNLTKSGFDFRIGSKVEIFAPFSNNISMASNAGEDLKSSVSGLKVKPRIETFLFFNVPKIYSDNITILFGLSAFISNIALSNGVLILFLFA